MMMWLIKHLPLGHATYNIFEDTRAVEIAFRSLVTIATESETRLLLTHSIYFQTIKWKCIFCDE